MSQKIRADLRIFPSVSVENRSEMDTMPDREMYPIEIHDSVMVQQGTLAPRFILPRQSVIKATDGTRTGSNSGQSLKHFSDACSIISNGLL